MGLFSNRGASKGTTRRGPFTISISSIHGGHSRDKGRVLKPRHAKLPIEVEKDGSGYRLIDGVERVGRARDAGRKKIKAYVWS